MYPRVEGHPSDNTVLGDIGYSSDNTVFGDNTMCIYIYTHTKRRQTENTQKDAKTKK
jgi:hypothetical protein